MPSPTPPAGSDWGLAVIGGANPSTGIPIALSNFGGLGGTGCSPPGANPWFNSMTVYVSAPEYSVSPGHN